MVCELVGLDLAVPDAAADGNFYLVAVVERLGDVAQRDGWWVRLGRGQGGNTVIDSGGEDEVGIGDSVDGDGGLVFQHLAMIL